MRIWYNNINNNEIEDVIKIVKSLEDSGLLINGVTETVQNEIKEQKGGFLSMLLDTLGASLLRNLLTGKGAIATSHKQIANKKAEKINQAGEGVIRAGEGYNNKMDF